MAFIPNTNNPNQIGPQGGYSAPPVPSNVNRSGDPAQYPGYNPFNSRDAFNQQQSLGQLAYQQGQGWQDQFSNQAGYDQNLSNGYGGTVNDLYSPIWNGGGGYTPEQQQQILQSQGLQDVSDQLPNNYLSQQEQSSIAGSPYDVYNNYNANIAPGMSATANQYGNTAMDVARHAEAGGLQALQYGQNAVDKAAATPGLNVTQQYLQQAGMSDQQVQDTVNAAGRNVGAQFQATQDQIRQNAMAAGQTSPLALGAAMTSLDRSSAASQADAMTNARLSALAQQREAATGIQNTQLQAGQYQAGLGTQSGLALANAALQNNQFNTQANEGAVQYAGNTNMANQQYNANMSTGLQSQAEQNSSTRAAQIAGNRQGIAQGNQNTQLGINQIQSQRGSQVANMNQQVQQEGRGAATGQQQYYGGQANQANQFRLQGQQLTNQTMGGAASGYANWGSTGGQGFGDYLGKSTANALGQWAGPSGTAGATQGYKLATGQARRGGLLDHHQLVEVGEGNRPEVILPLDPSTSPLHRNVWEHLGAHLGQALGINSSKPNNFKHNPFGAHVLQH